MILNIKKYLSSFRIFKQAFGAYKFQFGLITILGFLSGIAGGLGVGSIIPLFALIVHQKEPNLDTISRLIERVFSFLHLNYNVPLLLGLIILLFFLKALFTLAANYINAKISADYEFNTRNRLFKTTVSSTWPHLINQKVGYLERVLLDDIYQSAVILLYFSSIILTATSLITYAAVAINISFKITAITLALGAIILITLKPLFYKARVLGEKLTSTNKVVAHYVNENVLGAKTLKAASVEDRVAQKGKAYFEELKDTRVRLALYNSFGNTFIEPAGLLFIVILFGLSYRSASFNIASFAAIIYLIQKMFTFVNAIQTRLHNINEIIPYLRVVVEYQNKAAVNMEKDRGKKPFVFNNAVEFSDVFFSYAPQKEILSGISFTLRKGEMLGLIGPSGAGKTTIVDLFLRLFEPQRGAILLDGENITTIGLKKWRENVGYVAQDAFLTNDTIENNIRFYDNSLSRENIVRAAKMANIYNFVTGQPQKFGTIIGERGIKLSGGQRQRIALARTLARKPKILILDEATSALDSESEIFIQQTIKNLRGETAILIIAHRLSTIKNCDRLIILGNGKIAEEGTPQELLQNEDSYFYKINRLIDSGNKRGKKKIAGLKMNSSIDLLC